MLDDLIFRCRALFRRNTVEAELDDELRFHLEKQAEKHVRAGMSRDEAFRQARLALGGMEPVKEECREARGINLLETTTQDARYGLRTLRKAPGFTMVALLTLALGIGANTAIFSVVYGVLLRPLPYPDASRLIVVNETTPRVGTVSVSYPDFLDYRAGCRAFSQLAAVGDVNFNLSGVSQPANISGKVVSPNFLSMLGIHPVLGRDFDASEEKAGTAPVLLVSYDLWQSQLGGDRNVVGRSIALDGQGFTIVGVLPPEFRSTEKTDIMMPFGVWATDNSNVVHRGARGDFVSMGRLAPGVSLPRARAEMEAIAARLAREYPATNDQFGVLLRPLREVFVGELRPTILVLFGAVMFVLLIACANVANLFLMRGASRTREMALRMAFGASRGRIVRQMLAESLVLAALGGILGLGLAMVGIRGLTALIPMGMMAGASVNLNGVVLLFAVGVVVLSALIFGLVPAMHATRHDVQPELREGGRTTTASAGQNRLRTALAIAEVAVALILLVGAGLTTRSLYRLLSVDPGFRPERVLSMNMSLSTAPYAKDAAKFTFWQQVLDRVHALPGVESVALGSGVPMTDSHSRTDITIEGMPMPRPGNFPHPDVHVVSADYAGTLGIRLMAGRVFADADRENAPLVGMINASIARLFFPSGDAVGKRFLFGHGPGDHTRWITIVGVVADTKLYGLANPARLEVYLPFRQAAREDLTLIVKSRLEPETLTTQIRGAIASIDREQPIFGVATMRQLVNDSVSTRRVALVLLGLFSMLALVLAAVGIYGVIAYSVAQRTHEIGIRMALGAARGDVLRMILRDGAKITGTGVAIGVVASLGLTRLMANLLFAVSAGDPLTFVAVAVVLVAVAMLACYIPARRTVSVDPMVALRYE